MLPRRTFRRQITLLVVLVLGVGLYVVNGWAQVQPVPTPTVTLTAEPSTVIKGQSTTLSWNSQDATFLDLEPGVGRVQISGSTSVTPIDSTTYTLTATGPSGTRSATARVDLIPPLEARRPFSKEAIIGLLKGEVSPKRVAVLARHRGIDFQITPQVASELRRAGATAELLATLREIAPK